MTEPIPEPLVLDPDRVTTHDRDDMTLLEHRTRAQQLDEALHATGEYAQLLWHQLDAARSYLIGCLPPTSDTRGLDAAGGASPTGPDDDDGWRAWSETYAAVTSVLAGPHGDSGFGQSEARLAEQARRVPPPEAAAPEQPSRPTVDAMADDRPPADDPAPAQPGEPARGPLRLDEWIRTLGLAALTVLAIRGLRPARATPAP